MSKAILLGGTGSLTRTAEVLATIGWDVTVTARHPDRVPPTFRDLGIRCVAVDQDDSAELDELVHNAALIVDGLVYEPDDARRLARWSQDALTVMISSAAVYVDAAGNHQNSEEPASWDGPIREDAPTMPYAGLPARSRLGYGAAKAEGERILLAHAEVPLILRPAKIHAPGMRNPREWHVVKRVLDGRPVLARPGVGAESTTSGEALADAIVAHVAVPETRVLNVADADAPDQVQRATQLVQVVAEVAGVPPVPVVDASPAPDGLGTLPWRSTRVLETGALRELGVVPQRYSAAVVPAVRWLVEQAERAGDGLFRLPGWLEGGLFDGVADYSAEENFLRR